MKLCLGDALIRNPASLIDISKKYVNSTAHSILATGAQAGEAMVINNPDFQGLPGETTTISGSQAYLKIVAGSIAGTSYSGLGSTNPLIDLLTAIQQGRYGDESAAGIVQSLGGPILKHGNMSYIFDPTAPTLGSRAIALDAELSEEEKSYYIQRGALLYETIDKDKVLINGFQVDFPDEWKNEKLISTQTYYPGVEKENRYVSSSLISAPQQKAYICASMIELLLALVDKMGINGTFGSDVALIQSTTENTAGANYTTVNPSNRNNSTISDHAMGRAFDIQSIGSTQENMQPISTDAIKYEIQLDTLLEALNTMPMPLLPDLIVIHPEVARKYGVSDVFESPQVAIKMKYPNLKYVNFESNDNHKNHIHISFSGDRAGKYLGSEALIASATADSSDSTESSDFTDATQNAREKSKQNYKNDPSGSLTIFELFSMLTEKFFTDEAAAIFCSIAARESNIRPGSFNGVCKVTEDGKWGGDYSVGIFQYNLIALMNRQKNTSADVRIIYDGTQVLTRPKLIAASKLAYTPWKEERLNNNQIGQKMVSLQNRGKPKTDDLLWYPINQIAFTAYSKFGYRNSPINDSAGFYHWGDYSDRSDCGFIFGTEFQDAVSVYLTTGKDISILQEWVRSNLPQKNPKTKDYVEQWMSGTVFRSKPQNGTLVSRSKPISYTAASTGSSGSGGSAVKIEEKLLIVGDYPLEEIASILNTKMEKTPWKNYRLAGKRGRPLKYLRAVQSVVSVLDTIKQSKTADFVPDAYIIIAGNTDSFLYGTKQAFKENIDLVMKEIGDKKTYWFNIYNNSTTTDIARSGLFNEALDEVRSSKPNLLSHSILDWDDSVKSKTDYLSNGRSLSETGKSYFSSLVEQAANNLAGILKPGISTPSTGTVPTFSSTEIADAALWLIENRVAQWDEKYSDTFGCEGFANRLSAGLGILGATKKPEIFTEVWPQEVPTTLTTYITAQAHYNAIKNKRTFFKPGTPKGNNPPYGYLVFWTGGTGPKASQGHVGISLGSGNYIDQTGIIRKVTGSTAPGGYPGTNYVYTGSSSTWN